MRSINKPELAKDEEIILYSQGGYRNHQRSGWRLGHHYLTNKRLFFFYPGGLAFETALDSITDIRVEKQKFILRTKDTICISYHHPNTERISKAWIIMADLEVWRRKIHERALLKLDEETIEKIAKELDQDGMEILWYLWENKYAKINELADLIEAPTHMDVLLKIKEVINPIAERITGCPILVFERSRIDYETGEKVLFNWWMMGNGRKAEPKDHLIDVFDEGDLITVVIELPGVKEDEVLLDVVKDKLTIFAGTMGKGYDRVIPLPSKVDPHRVSRSYNNDLLVVRLEKKYEFTTERRWKLG